MDLSTYLHCWGLTQDGEEIITSTSQLMPVLLGNVPAMLKVVMADEEKLGGQLMKWWDGRGAARVFAYDDVALLMERAQPVISLIDLARNGRDDEASRILCAAIAHLHAQKSQPPISLTPLNRWFAALGPAANAYGGVFRQSATIAAELLANPQDVTVLHGDIHHGNILDFGTRGWLAIDPKGLSGERYFDYANLFCNPDIELATTPGRLMRQIDVVSKAARLDRSRLLSWVVAWAGLSATFLLQDGLPPHGPISIAELAAAQLYK